MQQRATAEPAEARERRAREIAALVAHPDMPAALRMFCQGVVDLFEGSRLLNLIVSDRGRVAMSLMALYLDSGYDPRNPLSGLTVNRYKAQCAAAGLCSPGRAAAMLGLMRFAGHLQPAARTQRGQPLRLIPTDKMLGSLRERWRRIFRALAQIRPEGEIGLARLDDPAFAKVLVRELVDLYLARERPVEHGPEMELFIERKAGFVVLMSLMLTAAPGDDIPPRGPISAPVAALARRFAVSRAQVKDILDSAVAADLLTPAGSDRSGYLTTPRLRESLLAFMAALFALDADGIAEADLALREEQQPIEGAA
jgi:hypothetical protein